MNPEQELEDLLNIELNNAIVDELLLQENATEPEREFVMECYRKTNSPWDAAVMLQIYRNLKL